MNLRRSIFTLSLLLIMGVPLFFNVDANQNQELRVIFVVDESSNMINANQPNPIDPDGHRTQALEGVLDYLVEYDREFIQPLYGDTGLDIFVAVIYFSDRASLLEFNHLGEKRIWLPLNAERYRGNPLSLRDDIISWKDTLANQACATGSSPCGGSSMNDVGQQFSRLFGDVSNRSSTHLGVVYITDGIMCGPGVGTNCSIEYNEIPFMNSHIRTVLTNHVSILNRYDNKSVYGLMIGNLYTGLSTGLSMVWEESGLFNNPIIQIDNPGQQIYPRLIGIINEIIVDRIGIPSAAGVHRYRVNEVGLIDADGNPGYRYDVPHFSEHLTVIAGFARNQAGPYLRITPPHGTSVERSGDKIEIWKADAPAPGEWGIRLNHNLGEQIGDEWVYIVLRKSYGQGRRNPDQTSEPCHLYAASDLAESDVFQYERVMLECTFFAPSIERHNLQDRIQIDVTVCSGYEAGQPICQPEFTLDGSAYHGNGVFKEAFYFHSPGDHWLNITIKVDETSVSDANFRITQTVNPVNLVGLTTGWTSCNETIYLYPGQRWDVYYEFAIPIDVSPGRLDFQHVSPNPVIIPDGDSQESLTPYLLTDSRSARVSDSVRPVSFVVRMTPTLTDGYPIPLPASQQCYFELMSMINITHEIVDIEPPVPSLGDSTERMIVFRIDDVITVNWVLSQRRNVIIRYRIGNEAGDLRYVENALPGEPLRFELPIAALGLAAGTYELQYQLVWAMQGDAPNRDRTGPDVGVETYLVPYPNDGGRWLNIPEVIISD